ncbi:MAG: DUF4389 domain-containing protein [Gaiellaceae bacterium]
MNEHPITLHVMDDLRRSRLTVFFRLLLFIPHYIWLGLWGYVLVVVLILNWIVALVIGRPAKPFQRFTAAYLRYSTTVFSYVLLVANPFPGFVGEPGSYPVELEVPTTPEKQNRLVTFFRLFLGLPALLLSGIVMYMAFFVAFLGWWASMVMGRMPRGLRDLGANALRYQGQANAYLYLATGRYPNSSPYVGMALGEPVIAQVAVVPAAAGSTAPEAPEAPPEA